MLSLTLFWFNYYCYFHVFSYLFHFLFLSFFFIISFFFSSSHLSKFPVRLPLSPLPSLPFSTPTSFMHLILTPFRRIVPLHFPFSYFLSSSPFPFLLSFFRIIVIPSLSFLAPSPSPSPLLTYFHPPLNHLPSVPVFSSYFSHLLIFSISLPLLLIHSPIPPHSLPNILPSSSLPLFFLLFLPVTYPGKPKSHIAIQLLPWPITL